MIDHTTDNSLVTLRFKHASVKMSEHTAETQVSEQVSEVRVQRERRHDPPPFALAHAARNECAGVPPVDSKSRVPGEQPDAEQRRDIRGGPDPRVWIQPFRGQRSARRILTDVARKLRARRVRVGFVDEQQPDVAVPGDLRTDAD